MTRFAFILWLSLVGLAQADYLIQHRLRIGQTHYALVIILPDFYGNFFGTCDLIHFELCELKLNPVPEEQITRWKEFLQARLWKDYERAPFLAGQSLKDERYAGFRFAERFNDGRSAIFAILQTEGDGDLANPEESSVLRALVRLASPVFLPYDQEPNPLFLKLMPWEIRALLNDRTEKYAKESAQLPERYFVTKESQQTGFVPVGDDEELALGSYPASFHWAEGVPLELKAWFHQPQILNGPDGRIMIDFLPDLLAIARMYDGFERTGLTFQALEDFIPPNEMKTILDLTSKILDRDARPEEIGIRANAFWTEVIDDELAKREQSDFAMSQRFAFPDPDFDRFRNHVLWVKKQAFYPAIREWAMKRRGAALLPMSRIVRNERRLRCRELMLNSGIVGLDYPKIQSIHLNLR